MFIIVALGKPRVLCIEDNIDLAGLLKEVFEMFGGDAHVVHSGQEGIKKAKELNPTLIVCDIGLEDVSGFQVAKTIRQEASLCSVYLVALTGYASQDDVKMALESGFDKHLSKPANLGDLKKALDLAIQREGGLQNGE